MSKHVESSFSQPIHYVMHNVFSTMTKYLHEILYRSGTSQYYNLYKYRPYHKFFFMISSSSSVKCMTPTSRDISHVHQKSHTQPEPSTFSVSGYRIFYASCLLQSVMVMENKMSYLNLGPCPQNYFLLCRLTVRLSFVNYTFCDFQLMLS